MCGINGIISKNTGDRELIEHMNESIAHRGPDSSKYFKHNGVQLGHVRLSIIDISSHSDQPLTKGNLTIVFNGEIYNYRDLRKELNFNTVFLTSSDTEVVLEAWRQWGWNCLQKLRGMFAFSIYDSNSGKTVIIRDCFGIKPLFYYPMGSRGIAFSSELKALERLYRDRFTLNEMALSASLLYVWVPECTCIWNEVKKLEPGQGIEVDKSGQLSLKTYWEPSGLVKPNDLSLVDENEAIEVLNTTLLDSVKSHLVADVPINAFLSGGLDSSLLVSMARSELDQLDCYTIKFSEEAKRTEAMADDAFYADKVSKHLDVKLNTLEAKPDLVSLLPKIVHHLDEPIGDSAAISSFLICDTAQKNGVKVLLSGMGADELFGGYRKHYANLIAQNYRQLPKILRYPVESIVQRMPVNIAGKGLVPIRWAKRFLSFASLPSDDAFFRSYTYYDKDGLSRLLPVYGDKCFGALRKHHHNIFNQTPSKSLLTQMCYTDLNMFMVSLNQAYTDRSSMAASTEVRVPFIDKEVISVAFNIDSKLKIHKGVSKYILKKVAEKWLTKDIIYRPKSPFTLPIRSWVSGQLTDMVDDYVLSTNGLAGREMFSNNELKKLVADDRTGRSDNAQKIWQLLTLEQWFRNHGM